MQYNAWRGDEGLEGVGLEKKNWKHWLIFAIATLMTLACAIWLLVVYIKDKDHEEMSDRPLARWCLGEAIALFVMPCFFFALSSPFTRNLCHKRMNLVISTIGCLFLFFAIGWYALGIYWLVSASCLEDPDKCGPFDELHRDTMIGIILCGVAVVLGCIYIAIAGKPAMRLF